MSGVTYFIVDRENIDEDRVKKLKAGSKIACNFWNHLIEPQQRTVIRLHFFTVGDEGFVSKEEYEDTIACAGEPEEIDGTIYGDIWYNCDHFVESNVFSIATTIAHEIGHTLGIGYFGWLELFKKKISFFQCGKMIQKDKIIDSLCEKYEPFKEMSLELSGDSGTKYSHWDEKIHKEELMTGYEGSKDLKRGFILPQTLKILEFLPELKHNLKKPAIEIIEKGESVKVTPMLEEAEKRFISDEEREKFVARRKEYKIRPFNPVFVSDVITSKNNWFYLQNKIKE